MVDRLSSEQFDEYVVTATGEHNNLITADAIINRVVNDMSDRSAVEIQIKIVESLM